jgi:hypothetical protein
MIGPPQLARSPTHLVRPHIKVASEEKLASRGRILYDDVAIRD